MEKRNKRFCRATGIREYRKVFNIFMEGKKTEPIYFGLLKLQCTKVSIFLYTSTSKTDPKQVLERAKRHVRKNRLGKNEEIWIVVDVDNREKDKFNKLFEWGNKNENHGIAISNPCFEYWLLLHYENGDKVGGLRICKDRLKRYLPHYEKNNLGVQQIENKLFERAVINGKKKHKQCKNWHCDNHSTVYILVEKILIEEKSPKKYYENIH